MTEGGCDGKLKTRDSTYKKRKDMNWSMPTPIILTQPRSFTSSCRSLICSHNFSTKPPCLKEISLVDLAQQRTWPPDYWKLGEMPPWLNQTLRQRFKKDSKFALILLHPLAAPVLPSLTT
jgi:hypothetical protein